MRGDSKMIVYVNITEFSRGQLVSGDIHVRPSGSN
jgi:hypothetical protein